MTQNQINQIIESSNRFADKLDKGFRLRLLGAEEELANQCFSNFLNHPHKSCGRSWSTLVEF